jgi:hypothetical protein
MLDLGPLLTCTFGSSIMTGSGDSRGISGVSLLRNKKILNQ